MTTCYTLQNIYLLLSIYATVNCIDYLDFLTRFGYLEEVGRGSQLSDEAVDLALRQFQRINGLDITGEVDEETLHTMSQPRCGVKDVIPGRSRGKRSSQANKWPNHVITYNISSWSRHLPSHVVEPIIRRAMDLWEEHADITFIKSNQAIIEIKFGEAQHGCDTVFFDSVLAHAFPPSQNSISGDVHFNEKFRWTTREYTLGNDISLFAVAVHEIGHAIGLAHSMEGDVRSFMNPRDTQNAHIFTRMDIWTVQSLYGPSKKTKRYGMEDANRRQEEEDQRRTEERRKQYENDRDRERKEDRRREWQREEEIQRRRQERLDKQNKDQAERDRRIKEMAEKQRQRDEEWRRKHNKNEEIVDIPQDTIKPDPCRSGADAVGTIRGEYIVFKDEWVWRVAPKDHNIVGPILISSLFKRLPWPIDAAVEVEDRLWIFVGQQLYVYNGFNLESAPQPLTELGIAEDVLRIQLAYPWHYFKPASLYLWSGEQYWKLNARERKVELKYPRKIHHNWKFVPHDSTAAFSMDDELYFIRGEEVYRMNSSDWRLQISNGWPKHISHVWNSCQKVHHMYLNSFNNIQYLISFLLYIIYV